MTGELQVDGYDLIRLDWSRRGGSAACNIDYTYLQRQLSYVCINLLLDEKELAICRTCDLKFPQFVGRIKFSKNKKKSGVEPKCLFRKLYLRKRNLIFKNKLKRMLIIRRNYGKLLSH